MIQLTVALPIWNSKTIAWLAMEGLCRQEHPGCEWELLIMEEQIKEFGAEAVSTYADRLKKVGCTSLRYFALDFHVPLPQKWKALAGKRSQTSKGFLLQAADCYSEPQRLKRTLAAINNGYDWIQNRKGYYYSVRYNKVILFDQKTFGAGCKTGLNMAIASRLLDSLPDSFQNSGIDNWLFRMTNPKKVLWIEDLPPNGVDVDGLNNISFARRHNFYNPKPPFVSTDIDIKEILSKEVAERLINTEGRKG